MQKPIKALTLAASLVLSMSATAYAGPQTAIEKAVSLENTARTEADRVRDEARKPAEVLQFLGVRPDMVLVENLPGGGWYSRILIPLLKENGTYYAAQAAPELFVSTVPEDLQERFLKTTREWQSTFAERYADVAGPRTKAFFYGSEPDSPAYLASNSVDMVFDVRSIHNLLSSGDETTDLIFSEFYRVLKPGGVFAVIDHREDEASPRTAAESGAQGYVKESVMIELATRAGFVFAGKSDVLSNPKDTKDHEGGVWSLPPTFALQDKDREKYAAIGESDRMLLKFVKPAK